MALRYAIVAHAVPACPQFLAWATINLDVAPGDDFAAHFYRLACEALGECSFKHELHRPSLRALQATVLIGLYELHRAHFGRAWLTVSRADWLTQTMQLRTLDSDEAPFLDSPELLDEARRAQWATSSLACMLMMGERMGDSIEEATTWLPGPPASEKSQASGISVGDIFRNAAPRPLSVEEALLAAHMLTRRVVVHVRETRVRSCWPDRQPYSFWTNQHRLEQTLQYIRNFLKTDPKPEPRLETMLDLYVRAWSIVLYEAKLRRTDASSWNAGDAGRQGAGGDALLQQTLELAQALQTRVLPVDAASLITVSWVVYVALQSLLRGKRRLSNLLHTGPIAVTCALVMDSFDALQSMLAKLGVDSPIANFFLSQVETEKSCSDAALGKCLVGLADFNVG
ncbi:hypothetical protein CDD83_10284 [Cordyceps sp. RAO-2017]|nr:hypothetical protein CDD83_10284 [Cordyceps sp. RAO-2017]